ncbi:SCO6880 family protein, partial [Streptomyces marianii]|uniref:SCO6880 family protein n=1 Tax=Streptomyces marianii TaxID=1817406 RepID=UPI00389B11B5
MGTYEHDGAWTVSYQVRNWPQSTVYATFLQPVLRPRQNARRSMSLIYEPMGPRRAARSCPRRRPSAAAPATSGPRPAGTRARTSDA